MAQRILGLDLGASAVKAVLLESAFRGYAVLDAARAPVAEASPGPGRHAAAVRALLEARAWRFDSAVVAFPGPGVSTPVVTLPFTDPKRIAQTIGFEVEGQIPFELHDVAWDWQPLGSREGRTDLLVAVARKEELAALLGALAEVGVDPRAVVPPAPAYAALAAAGALGPSPEATAAQAVLDLGRERTSVSVLGAGGCEAARTFPFGTAHLDRAVARELAIPEAEAAALLAAGAGAGPAPPDLVARAGDPRAADALRRALAPLPRELRATLKAWRARVGPRPIARLALAGGAASLPAVAEAVAPEVEGPVAALALSGPAAQKIPPGEAPGLGLALALALWGHVGARGGRLNLRRGTLAFTRDFEHVKGRVARLAAYAGLVAILGLLSAGVKVFALSRQEAALDRALCDAQTRIMGKCYPNFEEAEAVLRGRAGAAAAPPSVSAVDLFAELAARMPAGVPLRLDRIEITKDKLHVQGTTDAAENVDRIASSLQASRCFADARSGGARRRASDSKFEFSIDASLTCLESGREAAGGERR